jgi:hypothetical protein
MATRTKTRAPAHTRRLVSNYSSRNGSPIEGIAIHTTEGGTLSSVHGMFCDSATQASSTIGVDARRCEVWVPATKKAWTMGDYEINARTLNIENIGFAGWPTKAWHEEQVKINGRWIAYWSLRFRLPVQRGDIDMVEGQARIVKKGVLRHKDLTDAGVGSHVDPGSFPVEEALEYGRWYVKNGWWW